MRRSELSVSLTLVIVMTLTTNLVKAADDTTTEAPTTTIKPGAVFEPCGTNYLCDLGLTCIESGERGEYRFYCVQPGAEGGPCDREGKCDGDTLECFEKPFNDENYTPPSVCKKAGRKVGDDCTSSDFCVEGLVCAPMAGDPSSKSCQIPGEKEDDDCTAADKCNNDLECVYSYSSPGSLDKFCKKVGEKVGDDCTYVNKCAGNLVCADNSDGCLKTCQIVGKDEGDDCSKSGQCIPSLNCVPSPMDPKSKMCAPKKTPDQCKDGPMDMAEENTNSGGGKKAKFPKVLYRLLQALKQVKKQCRRRNRN